MFNAEYLQIGHKIQVRIALDDFSNRDKCLLFNQLMEELGITKALAEDPDNSAWFLNTWNLMMGKYW